MTIGIGVAVLALILGFASYSGYNDLVMLDEEVQTQWSEVENQYQRRADLIPNLVNTVKGYAKHEQSTLEGVINARAKATSVNIDPSKLDESSLKSFQAQQDALSSSLARLMVVVEKYPELKSNEQFLNLQHQLEGTENRIAVARKDFNHVVRGYNTKVRTFPKSILASLFGFERRPYFEAQEGADVAPTVDFSN